MCVCVCMWRGKHLKDDLRLIIYADSFDVVVVIVVDVLRIYYDLCSSNYSRLESEMLANAMLLRILVYALPWRLFEWIFLLNCCAIQHLPVLQAFASTEKIPRENIHTHEFREKNPFRAHWCTDSPVKLIIAATRAHIHLTFCVCKECAM